jgi:hypothetical protein
MPITLSLTTVIGFPTLFAVKKNKKIYILQKPLAIQVVLSSDQVEGGVQTKQL